MDEQLHPTENGGGWGCEVSCGGHHRRRGKTTTGSALDGAVFDIAQILAYKYTIWADPNYTWGLAILANSLLFSVNNILAGLWLNCISSFEITLFLLADILLQHRALFQRTSNMYMHLWNDVIARLDSGLLTIRAKALSKPMPIYCLFTHRIKFKTS